MGQGWESFIPPPRMTVRGINAPTKISVWLITHRRGDAPRRRFARKEPLDKAADPGAAGWRLRRDKEKVQLCFTENRISEIIQLKWRERRRIYGSQISLMFCLPGD